jgi:chromosome segregation ATPase
MPIQSPTERELLIDVQLGNIQDARNKLGEIVVKINELKKAYKEKTAEEKKSEVTTGEYTKSINLLNTDKSSLLKTIRELTIAQRQETLNLKAADDSIIGMRGSLAALKDEYIRLGKAAREGIGGTDLLAKIKKLNDEVSKAEQSMGVFSRNVGNYKSGFNGLSNSINQVAREMPNFAQSATIGFMALSNNLPILADEIQRVRQANALLVADGKPTVSVFKQIATAVFSWQSALITAISLSVIYA